MSVARMSRLPRFLSPILLNSSYFNRCILSKSSTGKRYLLSEAYSCQQAWNETQNSPLLQNVDIDSFVHKLEEKLDREGKVSAIDMDILASKLQSVDSQQLDFVQSLFYKFRHCPDAMNVCESTPHALVRALLHHGEIDRLLSVLMDKVHYGIFLDSFTANILLNTFIVRKQFAEAGHVAFDMTLQEDLSHPITRALSWFACHLRLQEMSTPMEWPEDVVDDGEVMHRRVEFVENPWYDGHFDIPTEHQRLGRSLVMITRSHGDDLLSRSSQLIGWALSEKFENGLDLLQRWIDTKQQGAVARVMVDKFGSLLQAVVTKEPPTAAKEHGLTTLSDVIPRVTSQQIADFIQRYQELSSRLSSAPDVCVDVDITAALRQHCEDVISQHQAADIETQTRLFTQWQQDRQSRVQTQISQHDRATRCSQLAARLLRLTATEERLRFFEEETRLRLVASQQKPLETLDDMHEEETFVAPPAERGKGEKKNK